MPNSINNRKGFSLIELMIVVAIVGILAAVAAPAYFKHILRSRQVDGAHRLLDIKTAQEKYYVLNDQYYTVGNLAVAATEFRGMLNFNVTDTQLYLFSITAGTPTESFQALAENDLNEDTVREDCWTITNNQTEPAQDTSTNNCKADGEALSFSLLPFL